MVTSGFPGCMPCMLFRFPSGCEAFFLGPKVVVRITLVVVFTVVVVNLQLGKRIDMSS